MRSSDSVMPSPKSGPPAHRTSRSSDFLAHDASDTLSRSSRIASICVLRLRTGSTSTTRSRAGSWSTISPPVSAPPPLAAAGSRKSQAIPSRNSVRLRATGSTAPLTKTWLSTRNPASSAARTGTATEAVTSHDDRNSRTVVRNGMARKASVCMDVQPWVFRRPSETHGARNRSRSPTTSQD